jgi:hypothetical protein
VTENEAITAILLCEAERRRAILQGDWESLRALLADDLIHVHARGGRVDDKQSYLAQIRHQKVISMERDVMRIRFYGTAAVSVGRLTNVLEDGTGAITRLHAVCTQVWDCSCGAWRLCSFQATHAPEPSTGENVPTGRSAGASSSNALVAT